MKNYFDKFPDSYVASSRRMIQTPGAFARSAFFYVQETGYLKLKESHVARRKNLESFLVVLVLSGSGVLMYDEKLYSLRKGSCFFIDCMVPYYHQSSQTDPWELVWVHFNGATSREYYRYFSSISAPALSGSYFCVSASAYCWYIASCLCIVPLYASLCISSSLPSNSIMLMHASA